MAITRTPVLPMVPVSSDRHGHALGSSTELLWSRSRPSSWLTVGLGLAILALGGGLAWWRVALTDHRLRDALLLQAQLIAQGLPLERIRSANDGPPDQQRVAQRRLQDQLARICANLDCCHRLQLLTRLPDGTIRTLIDDGESERMAGTTGMADGPVPPGIHRIFTTRSALIDGPHDAALTALIPLHDPATIRSGLATPDDARRLVAQAVAIYRELGRDHLLAAVNQVDGPFHRHDLYAFVYDRTMTMLAHPVRPDLVGRHLLDLKDWPGGTYFRREIQAVARDHGHGWVDYEYVNPLNQAREAKTTYVEGVDDLIICAGAYRGTGDLVAVLALKTDTSLWLVQMGWALLPPILLTLVLLALLGIGRWWMRRIQSRQATSAIREPAAILILAAGVAITAYVTWQTRHDHGHRLQQAFLPVGTQQTNRILERLRTLRDVELPSYRASGRRCRQPGQGPFPGQHEP